MNISSINNSTAFGKKAQVQPEDLFKSFDKAQQNLKNAEVQYKAAVKNNSTNMAQVKQTLINCQDEFKRISKAAKSEAGAVKVPKLFTKMVKAFGKVSDKSGNKTFDSAAALTKFVILGNFGKEVVGTALYTTQALTNEDLSPKKRKFVGMYDLSVGVVSSSLSLLLGLGLEKPIRKGFQSLLKPLSDSANPAIRGKAGAAIAGLSAFTSFAIQTILCKRIIAPAIATPTAGMLRDKMEAKEAQKNAEKEKINPLPNEALVLAKTEKK